MGVIGESLWGAPLIIPLRFFVNVQKNGLR